MMSLTMVRDQALPSGVSQVVYDAAVINMIVKICDPYLQDARDRNAKGDLERIHESTFQSIAADFERHQIVDQLDYYFYFAEYRHGTVDEDEQVLMWQEDHFYLARQFILDAAEHNCSGVLREIMVGLT